MAQIRRINLMQHNQPWWSLRSMQAAMSSPRHRGPLLVKLGGCCGLFFFVILVLVSLRKMHVHLSMDKERFHFSVDIPIPREYNTSTTPRIRSKATTSAAAAANGKEETNSIPPLSDLISGSAVTGDVQFLLDFAIVGFSKSGTTSLKAALSSPSLSHRIQPIPKDNWELTQDRPLDLIRNLYGRYEEDLREIAAAANATTINTTTTTTKLPQKPRLHGMKAPSDLHNPHGMKYYRSLFPKTKLIIVTRHPVEWLQSLYNGRIPQQNPSDFININHPNFLKGVCTAGKRNICTQKANLAYYLMGLGKQHSQGVKPTSELEINITTQYPNMIYDPRTVPYTPNDIFLLDTQQLQDTDEVRLDSLKRDLQSFLGLAYDDEEEDEEPLILPDGQPFPRIYSASAEKEEPNAVKIDICQEQYIPVRRELMQQARWASEWITTEFIDLPGIHVANPLHLKTTIYKQYYNQDPCAAATNTTATGNATASNRGNSSSYDETNYTTNDNNIDNNNNVKMELGSLDRVAADSVPSDLVAEIEKLTATMTLASIVANEYQSMVAFIQRQKEEEAGAAMKLALEKAAASRTDDAFYGGSGGVGIGAKLKRWFGGR